MLVKFPVFLGGALKQSDFLPVEQPFGQHIAVDMVIAYLLIVQRTFSHENTPAVGIRN